MVAAVVGALMSGAGDDRPALSVRCRLMDKPDATLQFSETTVETRRTHRQRRRGPRGKTVRWLVCYPPENA